MGIYLKSIAYTQTRHPPPCSPFPIIFFAMSRAQRSHALVLRNNREVRLLWLSQNFRAERVLRCAAREGKFIAQLQSALSICLDLRLLDVSGDADLRTWGGAVDIGVILAADRAMVGTRVLVGHVEVAGAFVLRERVGAEGVEVLD